MVVNELQRGSIKIIDYIRIPNQTQDFTINNFTRYSVIKDYKWQLSSDHI